MKRVWRVLGGIWSGLGLVLLFAAGMHAGQWIGYGKGARDTVRLVIEMRQGAVDAPEPWDRGDI